MMEEVFKLVELPLQSFMQLIILAAGWMLYKHNQKQSDFMQEMFNELKNSFNQLNQRYQQLDQRVDELSEKFARLEVIIEYIRQK